MKNNLEATIGTVLKSVRFPYRLSKERLTPLLPYLRTNCTWCLDDNVLLSQILNDSLSESLKFVVVPNIENVESQLDDMHSTLFYNGDFLLRSTNRYVDLLLAVHLSLMLNCQIF